MATRARSFGDRKGPRKQPKPKHEIRHAAGRPYCWACSVAMGELIHPCKNEYSRLTPRQQLAYYRKNGLCGRCGQPANTHRPLCKCKQGECGCWEAHSAPEVVNPVLEGQGELFGPHEAPQGRRRGKDYLDPG